MTDGSQIGVQRSDQAPAGAWSPNAAQSQELEMIIQAFTSKLDVAASALAWAMAMMAISLHHRFTRPKLVLNKAIADAYLYLSDYVACERAGTRSLGWAFGVFTKSELERKPESHRWFLSVLESNDDCLAEALSNLSAAINSRNCFGCPTETIDAIRGKVFDEISSARDLLSDIRFRLMHL